MNIEKIVLVFLLMTFPFLLSAQRTDWSEWELNGKVRILDKKIFIPNSAGVIDTTQFDHNIYYFNQFGFYDSIVRKDSKGVVMGKSVFECNENGLPIRSTVQTKFVNELLTYSEDYSFSENLDTLFIYTLGEFNDTSFFKLYCYDEMNRIIEFTTNSQAYVEQEHFFFNEDGKLIRSELLADETYGTFLDYIYSEADTRVGKVLYTPQNETDSFEEQFDNQGNIVSRKSLSDSELKKFEIWKYEYDNQSNYLIKKYFKGGQLGLYVERKIDYY